MLARFTAKCIWVCITFGDTSLKKMQPFSYPVRCGSLAHTLSASMLSASCLLCLRITALLMLWTSSCILRTPSITLSHTPESILPRIGAMGRRKEPKPRAPFFSCPYRDPSLAPTYSAKSETLVLNTRNRAVGGCYHGNEGKILFPSTLLY